MKEMQTEYTYNLIAYHDSWISLDPIIGCRYNCQYCVLRLPAWTQKIPERLFSPEEAVDRLINHRYFVHDKTVICFGNRTDSFLKDNIDFTLRVLLEFEKHNLSNPICIATKCQIPMKFIKEVKTLKDLKLIIFLSYSGLAKHLEPGIDFLSIRKTFKVLANEGIPVVHFWRPLIPSNTSDSQIQNMLAFVSKYAKASVIVGLKYSPESRKIFDDHPELRIPDDNIPLYGDWLLQNIEEKLLKIAKTQFLGYPIFKHTSCAVSYIFHKPDYNATIYRDDICKVSTCPNSQRKICESAVFKPTIQQVSTLMKHLGLNLPFEVNEHKIIIRGEISQEDYMFLLHNLNYPIKAKVNFTNVWHGSIFKGIDNTNNKLSRKYNCVPAVYNTILFV